MKLLPNIVMLPILLFGALRAVAAVPRQKPLAANAILVPRQTYRMEAQDTLDTRNQSVSEQETRNWNIAVTPREVIVVSHDSGDPSVALVAFDRDTGRKLWRKARPANSEAKELFGSDASGTEVTPRNAQTKQTNAYLKLLGTASRQDGRSVVVLVFTLYDTSNPRQWTLLAYELHGLEAESGHEIWQSALSDADFENRQRPTGVYGNVIAINTSGQVSNAKTQQTERRGSGAHAILLDAFNGQAVVQATPEGKAALNRSCEQHGSPLVAFDINAQTPHLLHLDTGMAQKVSEAAGFGYIRALGVTGTRGMFFANMDTDFAGGSAMPHYVYGVDGTGKLAWQFPAHILIPDTDFATGPDRGSGRDTR